jgi:hypothetical protein
MKSVRWNLLVFAFLETYQNHSQDKRFPGRYSKQALLEHKIESLLGTNPFSSHRDTHYQARTEFAVCSPGYRSEQLRGLAQDRLDEVLSSVGIFRGGNPAPAITSLVHQIKHVMTVYKGLLLINSFAIKV